MKATKILAIMLLLLALSLSGCLGKKPETGPTSTPSVTEAPAEDLEAQFPDVSAAAGDEIDVVEPDLEADEAVDLGSIL